MLEKHDFFPNIFYDFIVFIGSTVVFIGGMFVGLGGISKLASLESKIQGIDVLLIFGLIVFLGYEYGRIAEAWSAVVVQRPLKFLSKHTPFFKSKDFLLNLSVPKELDLVIPKTPDMNRTDKWTIYFFASMIHPGLGSDLLKRYAWEKLSRNSAFSYCILFIISLVSLTFQKIAGKPDFGIWSFGTIEYTVLLAVFTLATYYEYYRRNSWNNDLLIKTLPVFITAHREKKKAEKQNKTRSDISSLDEP